MLDKDLSRAKEPFPRLESGAESTVAAEIKNPGVRYHNLNEVRVGEAYIAQRPKLWGESLLRIKAEKTWVRRYNLCEVGIVETARSEETEDSVGPLRGFKVSEVL